MIHIYWRMLKLKEVMPDPLHDEAMGRKAGLKDMLQNVKRDLTQYSPDFVKGYKQIKREKWWDRFNDRLTRLAAALGSSRLK